MFKKTYSSLSKKVFNWFWGRRIYLDYASLTHVDTRVLSEIKRFSCINYANPASLYLEGVKAKEAMKKARLQIANFIHSQPNEIFFTSGGTESNNLAIIGAIEALHEKGVEYSAMHIIISVIEHSSIRECANYLSGKGVEVEVLPVGTNGVVSLSELKNKLKPNTVLVSIMTVNNEIGSIQPIREIAKTIRHYRANTDSVFNFQNFEYPIFHTDASQAPLYLELHVEKLGVDLLTLDGAKIYGPRGMGLLYIKKETPIMPIIFGGGQESGLRSGTENIAGIMGLAKALEIAEKERCGEVKRISELRELFVEGLMEINPDIKINGVESLVVNKNPNKTENLTHSTHIINVSIPKIDNEFFVLQLDAKGIACSTKSSCLGDEEESYVLKAIGADSRQSIRFSFGRWTNRRQVERTLKVISSIVGKKI